MESVALSKEGEIELTHLPFHACYDVAWRPSPNVGIILLKSAAFRIVKNVFFFMSYVVCGAERTEQTL